RRFRDLTAQARRSARFDGLSAAQSEPLRILLDEGVRYLDSVLTTGRHVQSELVQFLRSLRGAVDGSITAAVRLELDAYHAQMTLWRAKLSREAWQQLRVVVMEAPQARRVDLAVEYFARLLGEPLEGGRISFAESLYMSENEKWALDHIAKQEL